MCGMELASEEIDLQILKFSSKVSSLDLKELLVIFDEANRRLNSFLSEKLISYQKDEMAITIFPIASFIVAWVGEKIAGYVSLLDNYIIGIFVADDFCNCQLELNLLNKVKQTIESELEVTIFMKNSFMLELYLEEGFNIYECHNSRSSNEMTVTLFYSDKKITL